MISHELRCIFIHIPRCAGSSVEAWLTGTDWWLREPETKHLTAGQAREQYAEHWPHYFKFTVVRDPTTRTASMLKYAEHFGLVRGPAGLDFTGYHAQFGGEIVVEHDHRFYSREAVVRPDHRRGAIYGNILDEPLDFVARFETLQADMGEVARRLQVSRPFESHVERSEAPLNGLTKRDHVKLTELYALDFEAYGYATPASFESSESR